jgi:hypothetical protein
MEIISLPCESPAEMTGSGSREAICLPVRVKLAASACITNMEVKMNDSAADRRIMGLESELKANKLVASKQAVKKNEALGIIFTHPSKEWQVESPFLCLSNIITMKRLFQEW